MQAEIFTKPSCPYCVRAKQLLTKLNIPYKEYIVGAVATKEDIQQKVNDLGISTVIKTVPQIFLLDDNGATRYIGGYSELAAQQHTL